MSFSPEENLDPAGSEGAAAAAQRLSIPGILLILVGILNLVGGLYGVIGVVRSARVTTEEFIKEQQAQVDLYERFLAPETVPKIHEYLRDHGPELHQQTMIGGVIFTAVVLALGVVPIVAGIRMRGLRGYGLALTGSILAACPCLTLGCCCFGLGPVAGIWSLVVLSNAEVKSAFQQVSL